MEINKDLGYGIIETTREQYGRGKSLVFTKLQEASMWADESIIHTSKK